ncbi:PREDICTED: interferon omega-1-like [Chrysochloris asiatica]|uniref:Interferon omega-1-like n=1 Tax=Chrysochloris asiatica TaxID=185453 RepID=A0A9B0TI73_CHRAS|nr:PREDICTED: interferon omega-1-like [Chrysochloris asiatica]
MALLLSLLTALVMLSYGPVPSLGCDLSQNHILASRKTFVLLGQMRRLSPFFCLKDRKDFRIPQEMVDSSQLQKVQTISVLHEMLQQTFNLFHTEGASAAWISLLPELNSLIETGPRQLWKLLRWLQEGLTASSLRSYSVILTLKKQLQSSHSLRSVVRGIRAPPGGHTAKLQGSSAAAMHTVFARTCYRAIKA